MKLSFFMSALISLCTIPCMIQGIQWVKTYSVDSYIGPEIYYLKRTKEGGAQQSGTLCGVRLGYDRIKRYKVYWGIDVLWAQGILEGDKKQALLEEQRKKEQLKSQLTDINAEARIGYTFQSNCWRCASITPYIGLGYFWEKNYYQHPSPLKVHFKNTFSYIPLGFLSQIFITQYWSIGLNFKVRYLLEAEQRVEKDLEYDNLTQYYGERLQYRAELPITYFFCKENYPLALSLIPFTEYRSYGHRANFPFDFLEVKLKLYGAILKLHYLF